MVTRPGRSAAATAATGPRSATVTLTNDMLVVGMDAADVAKSVTLGTQGGANLAGSSAFTDATADLPDARLATIYVDGAALKLAAGALSSVPGLESALAAVPVSIAGALTVQDASIIGTARAVRPEGAPQIVDSASTLAADVPGASLAYAEAHDVGTAISALLASVKTQPGIEAFGVQVDSIESLLGAKLEDLFAWVGDVAVAGWTTDGTAGRRGRGRGDRRGRSVGAHQAAAGLPPAGEHRRLGDHRHDDLCRDDHHQRHGQRCRTRT